MLQPANVTSGPVAGKVLAHSELLRPHFLLALPPISVNLQGRSRAGGLWEVGDVLWPSPPEGTLGTPILNWRMEAEWGEAQTNLR